MILRIATQIALFLALCSSTLSQTLPQPPQPDLPETPLPPSESPLQLPPFTPSPMTAPIGSIKVTQIELINNTVIQTSELEKITVLSDNIPISAIENKSIEFSDLLQIASQVAEYYAQQGYKTSGAIVVIPEETRQKGEGIVKVQVIEGILERIDVTIQDENVLDTRFDSYVRKRLKVRENKPLNVDNLLEALQLLQLDPLIKQVSATLTQGIEPNSSQLIVTYQPNNPLSLGFLLDNGRSPSVGSFERGAAFNYDNVLGLGDKIRLSYLNTDGSDRPQVSYEIPFTADNATIRFDYVYNDSAIIEPPFDDIDQDGQRPDITSNYDAYDVTIRYPLIRSIKNQTFREFTLGLNGSWRNTQSFLFGEPFPFSLSADVLGNTRVFALRFSQNYTQQSATEIIAFRSQFSMGLDAFGSTISPQVAEIDVADSQFVSWRGQGQYVKFLADDTLWLVRSNVQLADRPLLPIEQFSTGGLGSVRGYRQDQLLTDNGFFATTEVRLPILRIPDGNQEGVLQFVPFIDYGLGWNTDLPNPRNNSLLSLGFGLLWQLGDFNARIDWGIPLTDFERRQQSWNENGLYFRVQYGRF
ncbi:MAG: ShlB/FhaC/HecB family hemolysin secretion/activation protein [Microcystaceae cyanobacterium]